MIKPKAYLFDVGNVILAFDFSIAVEKLRAFGITHESPLAHIEEIKDRYENGELGNEQFVELAIEQLGFQGTKADFVPIWQQIFELNQPMVTTITQLAEQSYPLHLFSNTNGMHVDHFLSEYEVFNHFKGGIYSHEAKSMKPDLPMYQQAIKRFDLNPEETLYIDDLPANIETGKSLGFQTHLYDKNDHAALVAVLG